MKRFLVILAISAIAGSAGLLAQASPAAADVDDFTFSSFDATYELSRDADGYATLHTTETLVAQFPQGNQNHGIRRDLVETFDGHPTDIELESVTDETGAPRSYELDEDGNFLEVTIAADEFVHGGQTYVLTYTQRNVVLFTPSVEDFYWDTVGSGWSQPFGQVTATVIIDPALTDALTGAVDSAWGPEGGDNGQAQTEQTPDGYVFTQSAVPTNNNVSFAIGFAPGTFTPRPSGFFDSVLPSITAFFLLLTLVGLALAIVVRRTRLRDAPGRGIIVAEYVAPKDPLPISAVVFNRRAKAVPAQLLDLAVRGNLRVRENTTKRKPSYEIEFVTSTGADEYGDDFLRAFFGGDAKAGKTRSLAKQDTKVAAKVTAILKKATKDATKQGYRRTVKAGASVGVIVVTGLGAIGTFFFAIASLDAAYGSWIPAAMLAAAIVLAVIAGFALAKSPLDAKGVELRDYLAGLKLYISLAEEARLRYLQSPEGAERLPVDTADRGAVVKLNEKLLPYAVLFGNEKRWAEELGSYYEQSGTQPDWYAGSSAFNMAYFSTAIGSVSSSASSSFSSSSSGSGGGASSGGGGGGGGGGGV